MKQNNNKMNNNSINSFLKEKSLKLINQNKDLENLLQDINNINTNILRYTQIDNLLNSDIKYDNEKDMDIINLQKYLDKNELKQNNIKDFEKQKLFGDFKNICNKVYSPKKTIETEASINRNLYLNNNIKPYKNSIKDAMNSIFKKHEVRLRNRYFPIYKSHTKDKNSIIKLDLSKKLSIDTNINPYTQIILKNNSHTDRVIDDYKSSKRRYFIPKTIENDEKINIGYGNYASNSVKYKHPQFYVLNTRNKPIKRKLPPIKKEKLNMVDLLRKNNSQFNMLLNKKQNQYAKYYLAMRMGEIYKFKVNNNN